MNAIAGISGGRTSARMAYLLGPDVVFSFQNTGLEHSKTYDFIDRLEQDLQREIVRLEYRAPERGEPPRMATFEIVAHGELARKGEPFRDMLECLRTFRAKHNRYSPVDGCRCRNCKVGEATPVAPWARQRLCTAWLKIKTQRRYCASIGWGTPRDYVEFVGLRADEPGRVAKMRGRNEALRTYECAPLFDAGINKADVLAFWSAKPFDLDLPEHLGNCKDCFLKDEADLASAMLDPEGDPEFWIEIERVYGPMRRNRSSYAQVLAEAPARMVIREALRTGSEFDVDLPPKRIKLIVAQERSERTPFSCECDAAKAEDLVEEEPWV